MICPLPNSDILSFAGSIIVVVVIFFAKNCIENAVPKPLNCVLGIHSPAVAMSVHTDSLAVWFGHHIFPLSITPLPFTDASILSDCPYGSINSTPNINLCRVTASHTSNPIPSSSMLIPMVKVSLGIHVHWTIFATCNSGSPSILFCPFLSIQIESVYRTVKLRTTISSKRPQIILINGNIFSIEFQINQLVLPSFFIIGSIVIAD